MPAPADLVRQLSTSTGTGNITLDPIINGRQSFNLAFGIGGVDVFRYFIASKGFVQWETGTGHLLNATTLVRDTVIKSSNSDSLVNFSAGFLDVTNDVGADNMALIDTDQVFVGKKTFAAILKVLGGIEFDNVVTSISQSIANLVFKATGGGSHRFDVNSITQFVITETDIRCAGNIFRLQGGHVEFDSNLTKVSQSGLDLQLDTAVGGRIESKVNNAARFSVSGSGANGEGNQIINVANPTSAQAVVTRAHADANYATIDDAELTNINADTSTALTAALSDRGQTVTMDNPAANIFTVPENSSVAFDIGTEIDVLQVGAGITAIDSDPLVTLNELSSASVALSNQFGRAKLLKRATDRWIISGNVDAAVGSIVSITKTDDDSEGSIFQEVFTFSNKSLGVAATDRKIIVGIYGFDSNAGGTIDSVTVAGNTATEIVSVSDTPSDHSLAAIYIADVPTGSTGDVVVTFSENFFDCGITVYRMTGATSSTAHDTATDSGATASLSATIDIPANGAAVAFTGFSLLIGSAMWSGLTEDTDVQISVSRSFSSAHDNFATQQDNLSVQATYSATPTSSSLAVASWST